LAKSIVAVTAAAVHANRISETTTPMTRLIAFLRSDLILSLVGGFAIGIAGIAMVKPASAGSERHESRAVIIDTPDHAQKTHS
jgi:hypothetical protein